MGKESSEKINTQIFKRNDFRNKSVMNMWNQGGLEEGQGNPL